MALELPVRPCEQFAAGIVVILDHRPAMRFALHSSLSKVAEQVFTTETDEVISDRFFAEGEPTTVVFSAHAPPHHDGLKLLAQIRAEARSIRLVLYGAILDYDTIMTALRADIDGLLPENAPLEEFADCFKAVSVGGKWLSQDVLHAALIDPVVEVGTSETALMALTPRQRQIAQMIAQGHSNKQIAATTGLAEGTVKMHLHRIFNRLKIPNRAALAAAVGDRFRDDTET